MPRSAYNACFRIPDFPAVAIQRAENIQSDVIVIQQQSVLCCTPGAKEKGIEEGDSSQRAERLAPDALMVFRKPATELSVWEEVLQTLSMMTPHMQECRVGMVLVHAQEADDLRRAARLYSACVGIATATSTAQLASYHCAQGTSYIVEESHASSFLANCSVEMLAHYGIDEECIEKLQLFGMNTLSRVAAVQQRQLIAQFGIEGKKLAQTVGDLLAHKKRELPFYVPPEPISASLRFEKSLREPGDIVIALRHIVHQCLNELHELSDRQCCWIGLRFWTHRGPQLYTRRILKEASNRIDAIRTAAEIIARSLINGSEITEMKFELGGLIRASGVQMSFLDEKVDTASIAYSVEQRYPNTMYKAQVRNANAYLAEERVQLISYAVEALV